MPHNELYIDGIWFPSVTTIMDIKPKPWLQAWREKWGVLAERKTKIANAIGTEFHRCVEHWLDHGWYKVQAPVADGISMPSLIDRVDCMVKSWTLWSRGIDGVILATEMQVVSRKHMYSGTFDAIGCLGNKPMIFDWKTSSRIYDDMQLQLAAYAEAYNETVALRPRELVKNGLIVHTSKDKPHFRTTTKLFKLGKAPLKKFLKLRAMFDEMQTAGRTIV